MQQVRSGVIAGSHSRGVGQAAGKFFLGTLARTLLMSLEFPVKPLYINLQIALPS
jgi:hypothetical protein